MYQVLNRWTNQTVGINNLYKRTEVVATTLIWAEESGFGILFEPGKSLYIPFHQVQSILESQEPITFGKKYAPHEAHVIISLLPSAGSSSGGGWFFFTTW